MRAHLLQHVPFEGLGTIAEWLSQAGAKTSATGFYEAGDLPTPGGIDLLIVMGGPMSVNDVAAYEWLEAEKRFIREAVETGKAVLGVCLGAQLIAAALGSRVYPNHEKEIGWFKISGDAGGPGAAEDIFRFPEEATVFHWHGETFDLPDGAILLASSPACRNQAFQVGRRVIGLQFHLEVTPQSVRDLVAHCGNELVTAPYIQTQEQILTEPPHTYEAINTTMFALLDYLTTPD